MLLALTIGAGACGSDSDHRPPEWAYISPVIFQPNCATTSCHSKAAAAGGLDFSDPGRGFESLFQLEVWIVDPKATAGQGGCKVAKNAVVCPRPLRALVTPYNPSQSRLINMLRARGAARMPPDRPLPEVDIRLVERWISNGALFRPEPAAPSVDADVPADTAPVRDTATSDAAASDASASDARPEAGTD